MFASFIYLLRQFVLKIFSIHIFQGPNLKVCLPFKELILERSPLDITSLVPTAMLFCQGMFHAENVSTVFTAYSKHINSSVALNATFVNMSAEFIPLNHFIQESILIHFIFFLFVLILRFLLDGRFWGFLSRVSSLGS